MNRFTRAHPNNNLYNKLLKYNTSLAKSLQVNLRYNNLCVIGHEQIHQGPPKQQPVQQASKVQYISGKVLTGKSTLQ